MEKILAAILIKEKYIYDIQLDAADIQNFLRYIADKFGVKPSEELMDFVDMCYRNLNRNLTSKGYSYNYNEPPFISEIIK